MHHALINLAAFSCIIFLCLPKNIINVITKAKTMLKPLLKRSLLPYHDSIPPPPAESENAIRSNEKCESNTNQNFPEYKYSVAKKQP